MRRNWWQEYRDYLFGLVSDVEFPWEGKLNPEAGFELRA